jgi:hypothetical protein
VEGIANLFESVSLGHRAHIYIYIYKAVLTFGRAEMAEVALKMSKKSAEARVRTMSALLKIDRCGCGGA